MCELCRVVYGTVHMVLLCCNMPLELCFYIKERNLVLVQGEQITFLVLLWEGTSQ